MAKRTLTLLRWFYFLAMMKFYAPIALLYFQHVAGSWALAASVVAVVRISAAILEVPTGIFSDLAGRKRTLVAGAACAVVSVGLYAVGRGYGWLVAGAILEGASRALYSGNNTAFLHDLLRDDGTLDRYAHHLGRLYAASGLGELVTALAGGFLAALSYSLLMALSVAALGAALAVSLFLGEAPRSRPATRLGAHLAQALAGFRHSQKLRLLSLSNILGNGIGLTAWHFQPAVYLALWPLWAVGLARAFQAFVATASAYVSGPIIARLRPAGVIVVGTVHGWLANVIPALFPGPLSPLLIASSAILDGPQTTAMETLLQAEYSERERATMESVTSLAESLFHAAFATAIGLVADRIGPIRSLLVTEACFVAVIVVNWRLVRLLR